MSDPIRSASVSVPSPSRLIAQAAQRTGADFDFLMRTAARESNFDANARATTSSAAGMFQFIEQTWLAMVANHGGKHGLDEAAAAINQRSDGRFEVRDPNQRDAVLNLRYDPEAASVMAGELAAENAGRIQSAIGREPTSGELYAAHFLGAAGAISLIEHVQSNPGQRADQVFPREAEANRPVFYSNGQALSVSELLEKLTGEAQNTVQPAITSEQSPASTSEFSGWYAQAAYGVGRIGNGVLTPELVELLASLQAPERYDSDE